MSVWSFLQFHSICVKSKSSGKTMLICKLALALGVRLCNKDLLNFHVLAHICTFKSASFY